MRIDSSGDTTHIASYGGGTMPFRVGYGSYSSFTPTFQIDDDGNVNIVGRNSGAGNTSMKLIFDNTDVTVEANQLGGGIEWHSDDGSGSGAGIKNSINTFFTGTGGYTDMRFSTAGTDGNNQERMRIDSSGVVSITNSFNGINAYVENDTHNAVFQIKASATGKNSEIWFGDSADSNVGKIDYDHNDNSMSFTTNATERMRIESGGLTRFKTQSGGYGYGAGYNFHEFNNDFGNQPIAMFWQASGSGSHYGINVHNNDDENDTTSRFFLGKGGSTERIKIYSNGNIENTNNSYGQLSDIKLKENITDATSKLDDLMQVQIKNFNYIGDEKKQIGVIAQELEEIFPALIYETQKTEYKKVDKTDEEGNIIYETEEVLISEAVEGQELIEWEDKPTIDNTKSEIQTWLDNNNIEWQSADTKQELLDKIPEYKQEAIEAQDAVYETRETDIPETVNKELPTADPIKGVKYSVLVPIMIKAMQEQQQIINDLKSRIETLENN